ncbi:S24 family peptidase [Campylobacter sp. FOBRC14]|uniref:S24 family peptidase n=1 Tax=Campylobacter sp. FOBRC14 TaxID=936554 RepID=UPI00027A385D|nr:S24 family peptidase [Campylobacter sp. FOBRC14]EJP74625.1 peptidase S24-like protein [Campylobacter sp. FOBRC14]
MEYKLNKPLLKKVLKEKKISYAKLAEMLTEAGHEISESGIKFWFKDDKNKPEIEKAQAMCELLGIPTNDLILQDLFQIVPPDKEVEDGENNSDTVYVPFFKDGVVSAGFGAENDDMGDYDLLPFNPQDLRLMFNVSPRARLGIIPCFGNSMEPTIKETDLVVFCVDQIEAIEGAIYVCRYDGELLVKRIKKRPSLQLISDNKDYEPISMSEELPITIIGRVVGSYSINSKRI